ncbi:RNA-directed DNA polymerase from mobile element jockey [Plakobranchus ocellatus]|uniref:RNA-directed DNA polymerase from mobile element jockey n=1 Tax=Plakobranchus ocellatus TaxID=259542 RepID=A0AAV3ZRJ5_9GAST|nr:RNA-directed DNA polymerase from mobile element jockey [Plakobranchus ocellatus]
MLFNLKINNIINSVSKHVNASLFVDDFAIYAEGKHLQHLERTIQLCINNVQKWVSESGFRFAVSKTTCVHFHRQRIYTEPALHLDGQPIPVKEKFSNHYVVFTDGSKLEEKVAAAAFSPEHPVRSKATRLRDGASVFSAELEGSRGMRMWTNSQKRP